MNIKMNREVLLEYCIRSNQLVNLLIENINSINMIDDIIENELAEVKKIQVPMKSHHELMKEGSHFPDFDRLMGIQR